MKPAIDQMIEVIETSMATYSTPAYRLDRGYRVLSQLLDEALKIKERFDIESLHILTSGVSVSYGGIKVVEIPNEHHGDVGTTDCLIPSICTITTDRR